MHPMNRQRWAVVAAVVGLLLLTEIGRGDDKRPSAGDDHGPWAPKLYAFCVDAPAVKNPSIPEQARMLRELGFDGVAYSLWLDGSLEKNLQALDDAGLELCMLETPINVNPDKPPYDPGLQEAIGKLRGRPTTISVRLVGLPPGDPRGEEPAVEILRRLGDLAAKSGLRISIYNHVGNWTESVFFALKIVDKVNHPNVGVNFNLCHWLKVDGDKDYRPLLRQHASKIFAVTINGAKLGSTTWTDGLIQPLDQGDFDNRQLLDTLRRIGYRGPIGLMCYGIPGDSREHLQRSMKVWRGWQAE